MDYLQKYVGKYRVMCHIDKNTNDFPKEVKGESLEYSYNDLYIPCACKGEITNYGRGVLEYYCPSIQRYHNILKKIDKDIIIRSFESSSEGWFRFKADNIEEVAKVVTPKTNGAGIRPFSKKNLPKTSYIIPEEDMEQYKNVINWDKLTDEQRVKSMHKIKDINNSFKEQLNNRKKKSESSINEEMRLNGFNNIKDYSHFIGVWDEYIQYLKEEFTLDD